MESTPSFLPVKKMDEKPLIVKKFTSLLMKTRLEDTTQWEAQNGLLNCVYPRLDFGTAYWMESLRLQSRNTRFCLSLFRQRRGQISHARSL